MVVVPWQAVTSLWSTQHQEHPGRTAVHHRPGEEGAWAEDPPTMAEAGDAVPVEAGTADETLGVLHNGILGL